MDLLSDFLCKSHHHHHQFHDDGPTSSSSSSTGGSYRAVPQKGVYSQPRWEFPPQTTHISVDCTTDKDLVLEQVHVQSQTRQKEFKELLKQDVEKKLIHWCMVVLAFCAIILAVSKFVVRPLVNMEIARRKNTKKNNSKERRRRLQRNRSRRSRSTNSSHRIRSSGRALAAATTGRSSSSSGSNDSLPIHYPSNEHLTLITHADSMDGVTVTVPPVERQYDPTRRNDETDYYYDDDVDDDDDDDDDDYLSSDSTSSNDCDELTQGGTTTVSASNHFDAQVPADFDAIPIVAATILPATTDILLHATVIHDGITYG
jgi:hypothetical protein